LGLCGDSALKSLKMGFAPLKSLGPEVLEDGLCPLEVPRHGPLPFPPPPQVPWTQPWRSLQADEASLGPGTLATPPEGPWRLATPTSFGLWNSRLPDFLQESHAPPRIPGDQLTPVVPLRGHPSKASWKHSDRPLGSRGLSGDCPHISLHFPGD
jgi:hypothetical protein